MPLTITDPKADAATAKGEDRPKPTDAEVFRRRMLLWPNPVEYVNNMYGCHPGDKNTDYFQAVFKK